MAVYSVVIQPEYELSCLCRLRWSRPPVTMATAILLPVGLCAILVTCVLSSRIKEGPELPQELYNEKQCLSAGGICLPKEECPEGLLSETSGLCPEQSQRGVECCYGVSVKERRCRQLGGECVTWKCPQVYVQDKAEDCTTGETCCHLE